MTEHALKEFSQKKVLLLQGPMGPFFRRLGEDLRAAGATVYKINFCGGDRFFYPDDAVSYRGDLAGWRPYLEQFVADNGIEAIFLYGDCRPIHRVATACFGVSLYVFEEGYVRPDYITFEKNGVNGNSKIPRNPDFYRENVPAERPSTRHVGNTWPSLARNAVLYYFFSFLYWPFYHRYRHHRRLSIFEGIFWLRSFYRKARYAFLERNVVKSLLGFSSGKYFLIPLQVFNDSQISVHSKFRTVEEFLLFCLKSFARHAPTDTLLVVKHHPMDRAYSDYTRFLRRAARDLGIEKRLVYVHDLHLPMLLQHARGVVLINSTVGLSSIHHATPTKVCGRAIYDIEGMTYWGRLDDFWTEAADFKVDMDLYARFVAHTVRTTQLNGSFYSRLQGTSNATGVLYRRGDTPVMPALPQAPAPDPDLKNVIDINDRLPKETSPERTKGKRTA